MSAAEAHHHVATVNLLLVVGIPLAFWATLALLMFRRPRAGMQDLARERQGDCSCRHSTGARVHAGESAR